MTIAFNLRQYLRQVKVHYRLVPHQRAAGSQRCAEAAHVSGAQIAKPVVFKDHRGYVMAVVPASRRVDAQRLCTELHRNLDLVPEAELPRVFRDCERGAVPPIGQLYGVDVVWDDRLSRADDIYFEAGNHTDLVQVSGHDFGRLMNGMDRAPISS